jgi:predicted PurR-regulated permease PerM
MALNETSTPQETAADSALNRSRTAWRRLGVRLRSITPSDLARTIMVVGIVALLIWLVVASWPALVPFAIGGVVAYIALPAVNWLDKFMPRALATILTLIVAGGLLIFMLGQSIPIIGREATVLVDSIPSVTEIRASLDEVESWVATLPEPTQNVINDVVSTLETRIRDNYEVILENALNATIRGTISLVNTFSFALGFVIVPAWVYTVINEQKRGTQVFDKMLPANMRRDAWSILRIFDRTFRAFVQSQLVQAIVAGIGVYIGLALLEQVTDVHYQYKVIFAVGIAFFQLIPEIGPFLGGTITTLLALINSTEAAIGVLIVVVVVEVLLKQLLAPRLERRFVNIHPALLVMAIVALSEFGWFWIILAAPLIVIIRDLFAYTFGRISDPARPAGILPGTTIEDAERDSLLRDDSLPRVSRQTTPAVYRRGRSARAVQQARAQSSSDNS